MPTADDTPRVNAAARAALERWYDDERPPPAMVVPREIMARDTENHRLRESLIRLLATFEDTDAEGRADDLGRVDFDVWCWRCDECAEYPEVSAAGEWRWTGTAYEHSHPEAQAHMPATCFGKWRDAEGRA
jgi:hypothetical protein